MKCGRRLASLKVGRMEKSATMQRRSILALCLMNSKLFDWYLKLTTEAEVQGGGIQLYVTTLEKTLLKLDFQQDFTDIVYQRIENQITDEAVDKAVFEAYRLTTEEQAFILQDRRVIIKDGLIIINHSLKMTNMIN